MHSSEGMFSQFLAHKINERNSLVWVYFATNQKEVIATVQKLVNTGKIMKFVKIHSHR